MNAMRFTGSILAAGGILLLSFLWRLSTGPSTLDNPQNTLPDAWADHIEMVRLNEQGRLYQELHADTLKHYPKDDHSTLQGVRILLPAQDGGNPWTLLAEEGTTEHGLDALHLRKNVQLSRPESPTQKATQIRTSKLTLYPKKNLAESREVVDLEQPGLSLRGHGLLADFNTQRIQLKDHEESRYEKNP